jgi:NADH/NAD ratio-sensing transcriptional regulator Rex
VIVEMNSLHSSPLDGGAARAPAEQPDLLSAKDLRLAATMLRQRASGGSYDDPELIRFYQLVESAPKVLRISSSELAERAGLGAKFFSTVWREKRRPKLVNFLRALTAIIEGANEQLLAEGASSNSSSRIQTRIWQDYAEVRDMATCLGRLARDELAALAAQLPNDPDSLAEYAKRRDLLLIFAEGFERIAQALVAFGESTEEPMLLGRAADVVRSVGDQFSTWWKQNGAETADWAMRLPVFVGGVSALGWAGANMTIATTAVAALVGGEKVLKVIKKIEKSK